MKIPSKLPVTAEQSRASRFQLGLTQANVIEQSELPGHKLKNFETGRFVPDMAFLQSLRGFYESKGINFDEGESKTAVTSPDLGMFMPQPPNRFVVDSSLPQDQVDFILAQMDNNDERIADLMHKSIQEGLFSKYSEETDSDTKMLFGLMAENYLLFRALQGRNILAPLPEKEDPETQADLIKNLYRKSIVCNPQPGDSSVEDEGETV